MRRRYVHSVFALVSAGFAALAATQYFNIQQADASQRAIASIQTSDDKPANINAQLVWSNKLSEAGQFEQAEKAYNELINDQTDNPTGQAAQYNLANGYLRQGMNQDAAVEQRLPMLELAKQRYRDLLDTNPDHWQARYNLERALRLAPENDAFAARKDKGKPLSGSMLLCRILKSETCREHA